MKETTLAIIITQEKTSSGTSTKTQFIGDEKLYIYLKEKMLREIAVEIANK